MAKTKSQKRTSAEMEDIRRKLEYFQSLPDFVRRCKIYDDNEDGSLRPRFLYKYQPFNVDRPNSIKYVRDIIVENKLYLCPPNNFNDPFDTGAHVYVDGSAGEIRRKLYEIGRDNGMTRKEAEAEAEAAFIMKRGIVHDEKFEMGFEASMEQMKNEVGIFCFAGDPRSILMWSHYGSNHSGICIQFQRYNDLPNLIDLQKVKYVKEYPSVNWLSDTYQNELLNVLSTKREIWDYEKEQRLFDPQGAGNYRAINPSAVVSIILGCSFFSTGKEKENVDALHTLLTERDKLGYPPLKIYQAIRHRQQYRIAVISSKTFVSMLGNE